VDKSIDVLVGRGEAGHELRADAALHQIDDQLWGKTEDLCQGRDRFRRTDEEQLQHQIEKRVGIKPSFLKRRRLGWNGGDEGCERVCLDGVNCHKIGAEPPTLIALPLHGARNIGLGYELRGYQQFSDAHAVPGSRRSEA
jgi:hypothetical protein